LSLEWSKIDRSVFHFVSHDLTRSGHGANENFSFMPLLEAQVRVQLEPSLFNAKSTIPVVETEEHSHPNIGPTHFVSALDKFNEIIPGCDAMRRFQDKPNWCLANKKDGLRCQSRIRTHTKITQLLAELAELNACVNMQECFDKLAVLNSIAVCRHQQHSVIWKLKSLLRPDRSRSSTQAVFNHFRLTN